MEVYSEPVERPMSSMGTGVKHSMKITSVPNATQYRRLSNGMWSSIVRGCRTPDINNIKTKITAHTAQLSETTIASVTIKNADPSVTMVDRDARVA